MKPIPPLIEVFFGLDRGDIGSNPVLAAAARRIATKDGSGKPNKMLAIEALMVSMANEGIKGNTQSAREFARLFQSSLKSEKAEAARQSDAAHNSKIMLTAELMRAARERRRAKLPMDPRQLLLTTEGRVVTVVSVELADRIRMLTRVEPLLRQKVDDLDRRIRTVSEVTRRKLVAQIKRCVTLVKELERYGLREMPNAEEHFQKAAEIYLETGRLPPDRH